ncbi:MAG: hypothetical protein O3A63_17180, partial [Proteobacteria bacterium]|nr:hypothetical protein [Pseudomonadota bacterium]
MTLTSWLKLVKPQLLLALVVGGVVAVASAWIWHEDPHVAATNDRFGNAIATSLAHSSVLPLTTQDGIHLGVLANRTFELPEVVGVAVYTVDNRLLALSGDLDRGQAYIRSIDVDNTIIGYVRVNILAQTTNSAFPWLKILSSIACVALTGFAIVLALTPWPKVPVLTVEIPDEPALPAVPQVHYLAVANLYNALSLSPDERARVLEMDLETATQAVTLYGGSVSVQNGKGLLLHFTEEHPDRCLDVVCAAFLSADLISDSGSPGHYRFGLNRLVLDPGEGLSGRSRDIEDTWLLAALARRGS